ncbi:S-adenosylmethionine sensor upstream of mTORC1 isoform X2 [Exaiptasia diaphana]|nr:S-adenosylmethionine sensor upstream of mTORC1 isoform X2 [Exaiptasia diaphana]
MFSLATSQWCKNSPGGRSDWCVKICKEYFQEGGLDIAIEKQKKRIDKEMGTLCCCCINADSVSNIVSVKKSKLNLLDVGSCYNPFLEFKDDFFTVAIDLCPATEYVYKCDFLDLKIINENTSAKSKDAKTVPCSCKRNYSHCQTFTEMNTENYQTIQSDESPREWKGQQEINISTYLQKTNITEFPAGYFHVVVFSLLLSYFPSSVQRWNCCIKAHQLLAVNGILLIITPDSSHQNRNVAMVKSWKIAIESIGFVRWKYVKDTHVHCMVFRKVSPCHHSCSKTCSCNVSVDVTPDMMYIRQDFNDSDSIIDDISTDYPVSKKMKIESV